MRFPRVRFAALTPLLAPLFAIAGCVSAPQLVPAPRPPVATPRPVPALPAPQAADWRDWAVTPGDWVYRVDARGSIAVFGTPGADALLTLRCDRQTDMVYLSRQGTAVAPLTLRSSSLARSLSVQPTGGTPAYVAAALAPRDPLLDAMAFSRGRFLVEQAGMPTLVVPAWAEVGRVTEDCRR
uniref:hypothetical protein n=1 Tax=uncultured Sphingomonas sp. TaxID=158754 RepID=UPI0035C99D06